MSSVPPAPFAPDAAPRTGDETPVGASTGQLRARLVTVAPFAVALFAIVHLALGWSAFRSAARFDRALAVSPSARVVIVLVVLGLLMGPARSVLGGERSAVARVRRGAWVALVGFLAFHLIARPLGPGLATRTGGEGLYDRFAASLSSIALGAPWRALAYLAGIVALAAYVGASVLALPGRASMRESPGPRTFAAGLIFALLFVMGAWPVVFFATGSRFFGPQAELETVSPRKLPKAPGGAGGSSSTQSPCTPPDSK